MQYLTLEEFKEFYKIDNNTEDDQITQFIKNAQYYFDLGTDLSIKNHTWKQRMYGKNLVKLKYHIENMVAVKLFSKEGQLTRILTSSDYFIDGNLGNIYQIGYFIEFTASIGYFTSQTIPDEIKSLIMSITKTFYDEYKKNTGGVEIRNKTIGNFTLGYFEKKVEKTGLTDIIETVRNKYGIEKQNGKEVKFYIL